MDYKKIVIIVLVILLVVVGSITFFKFNKKTQTTSAEVATTIPYNYFVLYTSDNKAGVIDKTGKEIIPCKYDNIIITIPFIIACCNGKYALMDYDGNLLTDFIYNNISIYNNEIQLDDKRYSLKEGWTYNIVIESEEHITTKIFKNSEMQSKYYAILSEEIKSKNNIDEYLFKEPFNKKIKIKDKK